MVTVWGHKDMQCLCC